MKITVFTPTYNRAEYLKRVYKSLLNQTHQNFLWLIIDDGSKDHTAEIVEKFIQEDKIEISYIKQENGGKHTAYNQAIELADTELFLELDSDDFLVPTALHRFVQEWKAIPNSDTFGGMYSLCKDTQGNLIGSEFKRANCNTYELRYLDKVTGDKAVVFHTQKLKEHRFPTNLDKIVPESLIQNRISKSYKTRCINEPLVIKEYLQGGLTDESKKQPSSNLSWAVIFNEMNYFDLSASDYNLFNSRYVKLSLMNKVSRKNIFQNAIHKRWYFPISFLNGWVSYLKTK